MKTKPFDLEAAKAGAPLVTRDGLKARFIGHVPEASHKGARIVVYLENELTPEWMAEDGTLYDAGVDSPRDLFIQVPTKTVYLNLYQQLDVGFGDYVAHEYSAAETAQKGAGAAAVAIAIPVEIEV